MCPGLCWPLVFRNRVCTLFEVCRGRLQKRELRENRNVGCCCIPKTAVSSRRQRGNTTDGGCLLHLQVGVNCSVDGMIARVAWVLPQMMSLSRPPRTTACLPRVALTLSAVSAVFSMLVCCRRRCRRMPELACSSTTAPSRIQRPSCSYLRRCWTNSSTERARPSWITPSR